MRRSFISLAAFLVAAVSVASGQCLFSDFIPMGEETHTIQIAEMELIDSVTNTAYILASSGGTITVSVLGSSTNPCSLSFLPVALSLTTTHPLFGVVTTTLDPAQYFGPSTASSSPGLVTFPAIEHLYLPIEIRMSSRPGVAYRSVGLIHLQATIFSWPPTGTLFPMITRFTLEDTRRPGVTVYSCRRFSLRF